MTQITDAQWSASAPTHHQASRTYDAKGNVLTVTDATGLVTAYTYGADNEPTTTALPDSTTTHQSWTADGQLHTSTDVAGHISTYTYSSVNQLATCRTRSGTRRRTATTWPATRS